MNEGSYCLLALQDVKVKETCQKSCAFRFPEFCNTARKGKVGQLFRPRRVFVQFRLDLGLFHAA